MTLPVSANLGFLWNHLPLPNAIRAAKAAGFDAVECHYPYAHPAQEIAAVLDETGLPMLGINTVLGPKGFFGLCALPTHRAEARAAIDQAVAYASVIKARHINVIAGLTDGGAQAQAQATYEANLSYAADLAGAQGISIVIEAMNQRSVPGAHFSTQEQGLATCAAVGAPNLGIMLDFFHAQIAQGNLEALVRQHIDHISHVQFAAPHDRGEPDTGEVNFPYLFAVLEEAGYRGYLGAEYQTRHARVEDGLGWLASYRAG